MTTRPSTRPRPAPRPKRTPRTRPWPFTEQVTVIPIGGWVAESMPEDGCDHCEDDSVNYPFTATSDDGEWIMADYRCDNCGAEWTCGWSTVWAMRVTGVRGGELWEREWS